MECSFIHQSWTSYNIWNHLNLSWQNKFQDMRVSVWRPVKAQEDFKWRGWSNVGKTQNPENFLGLPTKPKTITEPKKTFEIECLSLFLHHTIWSYHTRALPRIIRLFWWPPKKSLIKSSHPKKSLPNFPTQKNPGNENFKPQKILRLSLSLDIGAPSHWLLLIQRRQHFKS